MELVKELILVLERADPNVVVLTLVVAALIVWSMSRHARDIVVNVLRPVRAQDRALERRGVQYKTFPITQVRCGCGCTVVRCAIALLHQPFRRLCAACLAQIEQLSPNVRRFRVGLASPDACLGRHGHLSLKAVVDGQRVVRPYTPVSPPWQKGSADFVIKKCVARARVHCRIGWAGGRVWATHFDEIVCVLCTPIHVGLWWAVQVRVRNLDAALVQAEGR